MPKPVLTEVLADLLPFQQAVSNELGKLTGQIYTRGAAGRSSPSAQPLPAGVAVPRATQTLLACRKGTFPRTSYFPPHGRCHLQNFSVSTEKRNVKGELQGFGPFLGLG